MTGPNNSMNFSSNEASYDVLAKKGLIVLSPHNPAHCIITQVLHGLPESSASYSYCLTDNYSDEQALWNDLQVIFIALWVAPRHASRL